MWKFFNKDIPIMSANTFTCEICKKSMHKYKCPKCLLKYCSVSCFKSHKESGCIPQNVKQDQTEDGPTSSSDFLAKQETHCIEETFDTEDYVPSGMLGKLGESEELKMVLQNHNLREVILHIDHAQKPDIAIAKAMQEPIFTEFADHCLAIVEPGNNILKSVRLDVTDSD